MRPAACLNEAPREETTLLLKEWAAGSSEAGDRLMERVYPDLRRLAAHHRWNWELTAEPSDLAHETFLRLMAQNRTEWNDRGHFFAVAARLIRRVIVDAVKARSRVKRGGQATRLDLEKVELSTTDLSFDVLALNEALSRLAETSPSAVRVVELRYFAGLKVQEVAAVLGVSRTTVIRRWRFARAWLRLELDAEN